jgi:hypothetical protein
MKATFFCSMEPKCNNGQVYYCADCCDHHEHKSLVISKKVREISKEWDDLLQDIINVENEANNRYE